MLYRIFLCLLVDDCEAGTITNAICTGNGVCDRHDGVAENAPTCLCDAGYDGTECDNRQYIIASVPPSTNPSTNLLHHLITVLLQ